nr:reverse transcriptase domain-containing protein [Tanacetum cinerariifolium]
MQGAFLTHGTVFSIPNVLSWGGSIRPEGFLSSVLLWLVIIVAVVGGGVTVVVVVESSSVVKLSMPPERNSASAASTSDAPTMNQAAIRQLVVDSVAAAPEAQAANMANDDDTSRNSEPREAHVARKCSYKEFMSCQPFNFKGSEGAIGLIRRFERISVFP